MENKPEETETPKPTTAETVMEGVKHIASILNSGRVNPKDVYPHGRYHGD